MNILDEIFAHKRVEVAERQRAYPLAGLRRKAEAAAPAADFVAALQAAPQKMALIAEVKRASPSRGLLVKDFDPIRLARVYQGSGASAVSVLTDERYFKGSLEDLRRVSADLALRRPQLPTLRKDFICDPYQVYEARAAGAAALLLIAAYLDPVCLRDLHDLVNELGMTALVEVHNREELDRALTCRPALVGVNNRDLRDFSVRLETVLELRPHVPQEICLVAESGIHTAEDVRRLAESGIDAMLVGEALVTAADTAAKVRSLLQ